jgi:putative photosynthetic complex assembly protein
MTMAIDTVKREHLETNRAARPESVPRCILMIIGMILVSALVLAFVARVSDLGATRITPATAVESRDLAFLLGADGTLIVRDAHLGQNLKIMPPTDDNFIRVVIRDLVLQRSLAAIPQDAPYRLSRLADGQYMLKDTVTGRMIMLNAFGPANCKVFASLLTFESYQP